MHPYYQVRASRPEVSRDQDVFFSSVGLLCGGILIFQGWRLDPLMLFGELLTAGTAVAFASEVRVVQQVDCVCVLYSVPRCVTGGGAG